MASTRTLPACPPCETGPFTRNHFFTGKLLVERDFTDEQRYFIDKLRHHHQRLHGHGVVCGLKVKPHPNPACRDRFVCVEPGAAVDCCGREIVVAEEECVELVADPAVEALFDQDDDALRHTLRLSVCYRECPTENIPVLYDECACDDSHCAPNRILESFRFRVEVDPPEAPPADAPGVRLEHVHTLAVARAYRVAHDAAGGRVYVLSGGTPASLVAFDASNHSLVASAGLGADDRPLDLALSDDGTRLYLAVRAVGAPHPLQVRVLDPALATVNTLTVPNDTGGAVHVAVSDAGRLYAVNAGDGVLYAWDAPDGDGAAERQEVATLGGEVSALRLAADDARGWAAEAADASVTTFEAAGGTTDALALHAGSRPVSLAVVGGAGEERLFVGDEDGHLHLHAVKPGDAQPFPELGTATLSGTPVAMVPSSAGRWLFALVEEAGGEGRVQVVDAHALAAGSGGGDPLRASVPVLDRPRSLALAEDGRRLYAAAEGPDPAAGGEPGGGVAVLDVLRDDCEEIFRRSLDGCPECTEECLTLATIDGWLPGEEFDEDSIDNVTQRRLLPSTTEIVEVLRCLLDRECDCEGGGAGEPGAPGLGIDDVDVTIVECDQPGSAVIQTIAGQRTLVLEVPRGCDGADGASSGIDDVQATFVPCDQAGSAAIQMVGGQRTLVLRIPRGCDGADGADGQDGADGRDGTDGQDGAPGRDGADGVGLEQGLTRIEALSWRHGSSDAQLLPILHPAGGTLDLPGTRAALLGFVIGFTDEVRVNDGVRPLSSLFGTPAPVIDFAHVFQLLATRQEDAQLPLLCRCMLRGDVVPVDFKTDPAEPGLVVEATARLGASDRLAEFAPGAAWVFNPREVGADALFSLTPELWAALRGDFVVDRKRRAADVEFARAELPTGDRPAGSDFGAQGGVFDSWFSLDRKQPVRPLGSINELAVGDLTRLAGFDRSTARAVARERPFRDVDDLRARVDLPDETWDRVRDLFTVRREEG